MLCKATQAYRRQPCKVFKVAETHRVSTLEDDERRRREVLHMVDLDRARISDAAARVIVNFLYDFDRLPLPERVRVKKFITHHLDRRFEVIYAELGGGSLGRSEHLP